MSYSNMLRFVYFLLAIASTAYSQCNPSITTVGGSKAPSQVCSGQLVFQDEFDSFDFSTWEHEITLAGGGNFEFQYYTNNRSNSFVSNGMLNIVPTLLADDIGESALTSAQLNLWGGSPVETCTNNAFFGCERTGSATNTLNPVKSARIRTFEAFHFRYGRVEVRAKMPRGDWFWSAIWMMPRYNVYGLWPASGEIDISEVRGNADLRRNNVHIGDQQTSGTLHWGPAWAANQFIRTTFPKNNASSYSSDFHLYGVTWTNESISFTVDGEVIGTVSPATNFWDLGQLEGRYWSNPWGTQSKMAPFDQHFYLILNLAVGGTVFFPDDAVNGNGDKPWRDTSSQAFTDFWNGRNSWLPTWRNNDSTFLVDYVRVYAI
ncbi:beta-1,3-glucan-binding protein-like [Agrilus planipennis]|uniref:Beta-1,3-glucan-binding protein-like n=1 Tax=Agrilus planipennis TaxID=224129 RepID=A0A7F5R334_AGRPL|nr:beta-1,3-glucan-binding protein-like [Agrilus planipennis]